MKNIGMRRIYGNISTTYNITDVQDIKNLPDNSEEAAQQAYLENYEKFMDDELQDDDCFVILDCRCFP